MRNWLFIGMVLALGVSGCAHGNATRPPAQSATGSAPQKPKPIVTPETVLSGRVTLVNAEARYVVLTFPAGHLPALEQHLNLYRRGLKVGELKVSGSPADQLGENIVAYILAGDAEKGDEVKDR
jgi:hypothetical protein